MGLLGDDTPVEGVIATEYVADDGGAGASSPGRSRWRAVVAPIVAVIVVGCAGVVVNGQVRGFTAKPAQYNIPVSVSVSDASVYEGNFGWVDLTFTVVMTGSTPESTALALVATEGGTASYISDFLPTVQTVTLKGSRPAVIKVRVRGDRVRESVEFMRLRIVSVSGAPIGRRLGSGYIIDDDYPR